MGIVVPEWSKVHVLDVKRPMPKTNVIGKCFLDNFPFLASALVEIIANIGENFLI